MLFSSITFLFLFLPIMLAVYYIAPFRLKNGLLLIGSLFFYAWGEPVYIILMVLSILLNYFCGMDIENNSENEAKAKRSLIFAVVVNILLLVFFKYFGFFVESINGLFRVHIPYRELALPIGISFYTFQELSYIIDVYRGKVKAQHSLVDFALYVSLFPQLIAGPIVCYEEIEEQLSSRKISARKLGNGAMLFIVGLAKKVILANTMGEIFEQITSTATSNLTVLMAWLGCITYAFQIYFDFSGYSDMAIGLGRMFGFEFRKNFDIPYVSKSVTEFWRRWHISLSSWFREYVYIPLGGNRVTISRNILNLMIVWALTGMWHGAAWNFIVWGLYYGVILVFEKYVWGAIVDSLPAALQHVYALVLILVGWVFFFSPSLGAAIRYLFAMGGGGAGFVDREVFFVIFTHWLFYLLAVIASTAVGGKVLKKILNCSRKSFVRTAVTIVVFFGMLAVSVAYLITSTYNPFLYFRF